MFPAIDKQRNAVRPWRAGNEKKMIVSAYKYFSDSTSVNKRNQKLTLRKRIAVVLSISEKYCWEGYSRLEQV